MKKTTINLENLREFDLKVMFEPWARIVNVPVNHCISITDTFEGGSSEYISMQFQDDNFISIWSSGKEDIKVAPL